MVRRLLQAGADPNLASCSGETPLMNASRSGSPEVVEQLLAKGERQRARRARTDCAHVGRGPAACGCQEGLDRQAC